MIVRENRDMIIWENRNWVIDLPEDISNKNFYLRLYFKDEFIWTFGLKDIKNGLLKRYCWHGNGLYRNIPKYIQKKIIHYIKIGELLC